MKKLLLFSIIGLGSLFINLASANNNDYKIDDNGNIVFVKVVESPTLSKDAMYDKVSDFFIKNTNLRETLDKESGTLFGTFMENMAKRKTKYGKVILVGTLRIDCKDGKGRIVVTLKDYETEKGGAYTGIKKNTVSVTSQYPINKDGGNKSYMEEAFENAIQLSNKMLIDFETALKVDEKTENSIENADW